LTALNWEKPAVIVQDHLINAEFVDTELPSESDLVGLVTEVQNSSFIGVIGVQHGEAKVVVASDRDGMLSSELPTSPLSPFPPSPLD